MSTILAVKSSAGGAASVSNALVDHAVARLTAGRPDLRVVERDLDRAPIDHVRAQTLAGIGRQAPETADTARVDALSKALIAEVREAEAIVIGSPMYNFGITSTLKAWFDHVLRAGATFSYGADGPKGLVANKPVLVIESRGGSYSEGPRTAWDAQEPHLRAMLEFIGLTDPTFVRVEGLAGGQDAVRAAKDEAIASIDTFALSAAGEAR